jgi:hypothetical protein
MYLLRSISLASVIAVLTACAGCAHSVKFAYQPGAPTVPAYPCRVSLRMGREFTQYQHVTPAVVLVHQKFVIPYGPALENYATYVARSQFGDVQVVDETTQPSRESKLLVVPRVMDSAFSPGLGLDSPPSAALAIEWKFEDPKTGQPLLTIPVQYEYVSKSAFQTHVIEKLMPGLTALTTNRLATSEELRHLTER